MAHAIEDWPLAEENAERAWALAGLIVALLLALSSCTGPISPRLPESPENT